jgi:hypothetical protein
MTIIAAVRPLAAVHPLLVAVPAAGVKKSHPLLQLGIGEIQVVAVVTGQVGTLGQHGNAFDSERLVVGVVMAGATGNSCRRVRRMIEKRWLLLADHDRSGRGLQATASDGLAPEINGQTKQECRYGKLPFHLVHTSSFDLWFFAGISAIPLSRL